MSDEIANLWVSEDSLQGPATQVTGLLSNSPTQLTVQVLKFRKYHMAVCLLLLLCEWR